MIRKYGVFIAAFIIAALLGIVVGEQALDVGTLLVIGGVVVVFTFV